MPDNIHPIFSQIISRESKERLIHQRSKAFWFTGLSGSGKSTLARGLEIKLYQRGFVTKLLDGDNIRQGINSNLGFSETDRTENIRRVAEISKLFLNAGIITICCFISPTQKIRDLARKIIGPENFFEIYVECSVETAEKRDVKGLYGKARSGQIKDFTGINMHYEPPLNPDFILNTDTEDIDRSVRLLYRRIISLIRP
jgi:adenylylsulfate kinase